MSHSFYSADFCVNDDNGCFTEKVIAVEIWRHRDGGLEPVIELSAHVFDEVAGDWVGLPLKYECCAAGVVRAITLGGLRLPVTGGPRSGGNWCWDSVTMSLSDVCRLLNHLKGAVHTWANGTTCHLFDLDQAEQNYWMKWKDAAARFSAFRPAPIWFRQLPRKRRRKLNRQRRRDGYPSFRL